MSSFKKILSRLFGSASEEESSSDIMKNGELFFARNVIAQSKGKVILFDVGANVGGYTEVLLGILKDLSVTDFEIHMFEPQKTCYDVLVNKFSGNRNVIVNNFALSDTNGTATIHLDFDGSSWGSMYDREGLNLNIKQEIKLRTLGDYVSENGINKINLLKIDTEGNEKKVLLGAGNFLDPRKIEFIQFEYGGCYLDSKITLKEVALILMERKYFVGKLKSKNVDYLKRVSDVKEDYVYSNYVATKNKLS